MLDIFTLHCRRPLLDRLVADRTFTDFGIHETVVHQAEGLSHGLWWALTTHGRD